jgi:hypothetical protein
LVMSVSEKPDGSVAALEGSAVINRKRISSAIVAVSRAPFCRDSVLELNIRLPIIESSHPFLAFKGSCTVLLIHEHAKAHAKGKRRIETEYRVRRSRG